MEQFTPIQLQCLPQYSKLIPGTVKTIDLLRRKYGMKIGLTTGFTRPMLNVLLNEMYGLCLWIFF